MTTHSRQVLSLAIEPAQRGSAVGSPFSSAAPSVSGWSGGGTPSDVRPKNWFYGGVGDYFPDLSWTNRPADLGRSGAPRALLDAWTAVVLALQQAHGGLRRGSCYWLNFSAAPLVQQVLGEPVQLCAGFGGWIEHTGMIQTGFRWRPSKWSAFIDADAGSHLEPTADVHCWLETATHLIDLDGGIGDPKDVWPPLIFRPKTTLLKHPREAQGAGDILLWRSAEARKLVGERIVPRALPIATHAVELYETFTCGTLEAREEAEAEHKMVTGLGRMLTTEFGGRLANPNRAAIASSQHRLLSQDHPKDSPHAG